MFFYLLFLCIWAIQSEVTAFLTTWNYFTNTNTRGQVSWEDGGREQRPWWNWKERKRDRVCNLKHAEESTQPSQSKAFRAFFKHVNNRATASEFCIFPVQWIKEELNTSRLLCAFNRNGNIKHRPTSTKRLLCSCKHQRHKKKTELL